MPQRADALMLVKARLCESIDRIAFDLPRLAPQRLALLLEEARATAAEYGFAPFVEVSRALDRTIARGARGPVLAAYLDALRDAAGCDSADPAAGETYLASISVRLAG